MCFDDFCASMFELADLWCDDVRESTYVNFLTEVLGAVAKDIDSERPKFKPTAEIEVLPFAAAAEDDSDSEEWEEEGVPAEAVEPGQQWASAPAAARPPAPPPPSPPSLPSSPLLAADARTRFRSSVRLIRLRRHGAAERQQSAQCETPARASGAARRPSATHSPATSASATRRRRERVGIVRLRPEWVSALRSTRPSSFLGFEY